MAGGSGGASGGSASDADMMDGSERLSAKKEKRKEKRHSGQSSHSGGGSAPKRGEYKCGKCGFFPKKTKHNCNAEKAKRIADGTLTEVKTKKGESKYVAHPIFRAAAIMPNGVGAASRMISPAAEFGRPLLMSLQPVPLLMEDPESAALKVPRDSMC